MKILVVDDEPLAFRTIERSLRAFGHHVSGSTSADEATGLVERHDYDAIIVDWGLPDRDGVTLCREWRDRGILSGLLMLTGRYTTNEKVEAFSAGVDDYVIKPFDRGEFCARVQALAVRAHDRRARLLTAGSIAIEEIEHAAYVGSLRVDLTTKEFLLLREFVRRQGEMLSREDLLKRIWGINWDPKSNLLQVHMHHLREKLGVAGGRLQTVRLLGYCLIHEEPKRLEDLS